MKLEIATCHPLGFMSALSLSDLATSMGLGTKSPHPIQSNCLSLRNRSLPARGFFGTLPLGSARLSF